MQAYLKPLLYLFVASFLMATGSSVEAGLLDKIAFFKSFSETSLFQENNDGIHLVTKVCPQAYYFESNKENTTLRDLLETSIRDVLAEKQIDLTKTRYQLAAIRLLSESPTPDYQQDGRCEDLAIQLKKQTDSLGPAISSEDVLQRESLLKIGVRPIRNVSELDSNSQTWSGAAITFGTLIAESLGKKPLFVPLSTTSGRFDSIRFGATDLVISQITQTEQRKELAYLSDTYFNTGLVVGTFDRNFPGAIKDSSVLNIPGIRMVVSKKSTGEAKARNLFPKAELVIVDETGEIPTVLAKKAGKGFFITDEVIAGQWREARIVSVAGSSLLTRDDEYVVASWSGALNKQVNEVIRTQKIKALFARLLRRSPWQ
ncbi:MAG: transporter substrate-binding domain-containing protein [Magnetococcales bacterium]|nr:transporter substrate-binding domain-containing protein [Magnetococcales bacterium]